MAASIAAVSAQTVSSLAASQAYSKTLPSRSLVRATPSRRSLVVRAEKGPFAGIQDAVDGTKVNITAERVKATQGSTGRPELERRPETGSTSFYNIMSFDGPGPETMNGRLAMLGCVWALAAELTTGLRIVDQINSPGSSGLFWLLTATQITIWASLIPLFNGESPDSRKNGPFTAKAERWNGRLAMIGFAGILIGENVLGHAIFHM